MDLIAAGIATVGFALIVIGILDIFLTILHPDRDGPVSVALNRLTWRGSIVLARRFPGAAAEIVATAGAVMIAATIALWMALQVTGFALLAWPYLETGFESAQPPPLTFVDALYWSGVTFTTLGYGDVLPATPFWKVVALAESAAGFALVGGAITFLLSVFHGIELRDKMALRIYSETRRTWDGTLFVLRVLEEEGRNGLLRHVETWAEEMRNLHERLYRFQPLAFYVRSRSEKHAPERMLAAVGEVAVTARILASFPSLDILRPASDEIDVAYTEFALSVIHHHGSARALRAVAKAEPTADDRAWVTAVRARIRDETGLPREAPADGREDLEILVLAARVRGFLDELDRITRWRVLHEIQEGRESAAPHRER